MRKFVAMTLALLLAVNGLAMLWSPAWWYAVVPGVVETGPLNPHFVRDIGCIYVACGAAFAWLAVDAYSGRAAAWLAAVWLTLHAMVHFGDALTGRETLHQFAIDGIDVILPAILGLWLAARPPVPGTLWRRFAHGRIGALERDFGYDAGYLHEIVDTSVAAMQRFVSFMGMSQQREDLPPTALYTAKLVATLAEDCGPCTQLVATMAEREGVSAEVLRAVVAGNEPGDADAQLAWRYARAALAHDPEVEAWRRQALERWGRRAPVSLAYAVAASRVYPSVKYALGHGRACTRVTISGIETSRPPVEIAAGA